MKAIIFNKISSILAPEKLEVIDESHLHAGHSGSRRAGDSHFKLIITDASLASGNKINAHRLIHKILESELANQIHALSIIIREK